MTDTQPDPQPDTPIESQTDTDTTTDVITVDVLSPAGNKTGTVDLPAAYFGVQVNIPLIHQVVVA